MAVRRNTRQSKGNLGIYAGALLGLALGYAFNQKSGLDFDLLDRQQQANIITDELLDRIEFNESSNDPLAVNPKTNVKGAYQFKEDRWLEVLYHHGADEGYADLAANIKHRVRRNSQGVAVQDVYYISDARERNRVLNARFDRDASRAMTRAGLEKDYYTLRGRLGGTIVTPEDTTFYFMHHFGKEGATRILTAVERTPDKLFNAVVRAGVCVDNKEVCYEGKRARTVTEVREFLGDRLESTPPSAFSFNR